MLLRQGPIRFRKHHRPLRRAAAQSTPAAPVLVSATYSLDDGVVTLGFDRAVAVGPMGAGAVRLLHHPSEQAFVGTDGVLVDAMTVRIDLTYDDVCDPGDDAVMNAGGANGIVAVESGAAWAGVTGLELPYP